MGRKNILWIVTTQWRAQSTGYAGDPDVRTPHLDALAKESVDFSQAITPHPFGPFARAALFTGTPSPQNGVRDYFDPLPREGRTIAHELKELGYATAFFGKWHLGKRDPLVPLVGEAHAKMVIPAEARGGFDFWEGFESGFLLNDPWLHGSRLPEPVRFSGYQADVLAARAAAWLTDAEGGPRPWFAVVSLETPHPPYAASAAGMVPPAPHSLKLRANVPRGGEIETRARRELAGYSAHIAATDAAIGALLDTLRGTPDNENTLVVFTSVHGDMHGAHGLFRKGWPHEESVRVPLLIRVPRGLARRDDGAISLLDLAALTRQFAETGAVNTERPLHARISMPSVVALPDQCDRTWRGVRTAKRKLVLDGDGAPWLFFDLERDPLEMKNLVTDPARAGEMAALFPLV